MPPMRSKPMLVLLLLAGVCFAADYDLLLKGGHVIDPKNGVNRVMDVAVRGGRIAAVAAEIDAARASKVVRVRSLYVTPGLVDLHTHVFVGSGLQGSLPVDQNVDADSHAPRSGVTTVVDAGTTGWRRFPEFKSRIIEKVKTRVLAWLNIVGAGQTGGAGEQNAPDMDPEAAARMARQHRGLIVGIKTAHYRGPEWTAVERAVRAGELAGIPVMVDFGDFRPERPFQELVLKKLRPGDHYTHTFHRSVPMLDDQGRLLPYLAEARKRGVKFDAGHGAGSFLFRQAVAAIRQGFVPDSISTDLHTGSMNAGMNNMLNVMSKFLAMGLPLEDVVLRATWNPARQIGRTDLGHLSAGAPADIAVLRLERGEFGFVDVFGARMSGRERLACEMTVRDGRVIYDLNGLARTEWDRLGNYQSQAEPLWDGILTAPAGRK